MGATALTIAHPQLVGYKINGTHFIFASDEFKPSYWLILKREGFSGDVFQASDELDDVTWELDRDELATIFRLEYKTVPDYFWTDSVRTELEEIILSSRIQVFEVSAKTAARLANRNDPIYSNPTDYDNTGNPIADQRNKLAETLGKDIMTRWMGKDKADKLHWDRSALKREAIEAYDVGEAVVETAVNFVVSLWDIAKLVVTVAGGVIEFTFNAATAAAEYARKVSTGEIKPEDIRRDLEAIGVAIGDLVDDAKKLMAKAEEGLAVIQSINNDPMSRELIFDFLDSLWQSIHYRESRVIGVKILSEIGIEVLLALATGGAANVARRAAQASAKGAKLARASKVARIGPFPTEAIDEIVDLSKALKPPAAKVEKTPIRVIPEDAPNKRTNSPENTPNDNRNTTPERSGHRAAHEEKLNDHHQAVDDHQARYEQRRDDAIADGESNRTVGAHKAKITEAKGERAAADYMSNNHPDADIVRGFEPGTGFDQVWAKRNPDGSVSEYMIVEAKGPGAKLSTNANKGKQMSQEWVENTAEQMSRSSNTSASQLGNDVMDAIDLGPPPKVTGIGLEAIEQNGSITGARQIALPDGADFN
ncbi:MAG: hypothetical protein ACRBCI_03540 [Cellvibrionaceae bacterium]